MERENSENQKECFDRTQELMELESAIQDVKNLRADYDSLISECKGLLENFREIRRLLEIIHRI
jgi:hypothetical protein